MSRHTDTCILAGWMEAREAGTEERVTSVLAVALQSSSAFAAALLAELGVTESGEITVRTEVETGDPGERVDLELRVVGPRGRLIRRAWIEVKLNSLLAPERAASDTRKARAAQLVRYRSALSTRDAARTWTASSPLAVLLPAPLEVEREQINAAQAAVLSWEFVGEMAANRAEEIAGNDWRHAARAPTATLELSNLESLVWLLQDAKTKDGKPFMNLEINMPFTSDLLNVYSRAGDALASAAALYERTYEILNTRFGWHVAVDPDEELDDSEEGDGDELLWEWAASIKSTGAPRWWDETDGELGFIISPLNEATEPTRSQPTVVLELTFESGGPLLEPVWLERLEASGFGCVEDDDSELLATISACSPLEELLDERVTLTEQANALADWIARTADALGESHPEHRSDSSPPA